MPIGELARVSLNIFVMDAVILVVFATGCASVDI